MTTTTTTTTATKSLSILTAVQKQRVDEAFVELFGYPFSERSANHAAGETISAPPRWLCEVLSSKRQAAQIWKRLSPRKQRQLATRVLRRKRTSFLLPTMASVASKGSVSPMNNSEPLEHDAAVATIQKEVQQNPTTKASAAAASSSNWSHRNSLSARVQKLTSEAATASTLAKTALDWELYKEQNALAATLEEQATQKTAFLPKQEFLQRVDVRQYEKSRSAK